MRQQAAFKAVSESTRVGGSVKVFENRQHKATPSC